MECTDQVDQKANVLLLCGMCGSTRVGVQHWLLISRGLRMECIFPRHERERVGEFAINPLANARGKGTVRNVMYALFSDS